MLFEDVKMAKRKRKKTQRQLKKLWKKHDIWIILGVSSFICFISYMVVNRGIDVYFSAGGWQFIKYFSGIVVTGLVMGLVVSKFIKK